MLTNKLKLNPDKTEFILIGSPKIYKQLLPHFLINILGNQLLKPRFYFIFFIWGFTSLSIYLFIYLGFYVAFNTVQVISRRVVGRAEETSTYSSLGFCTVNCRPTASKYQLSHLRPCRESNPGLRGGRRECYHSATVAPLLKPRVISHNFTLSDHLIKVIKSTRVHTRDLYRICSLLDLNTSVLLANA